MGNINFILNGSLPADENPSKHGILEKKVIRKFLTHELMRTVEPIPPSHITDKETESHTSCDLLGS